MIAEFGIVITIASVVPRVLSADVSWCKDAKCSDCPSGLTSAGPGWPQCVIYDSDVVFGGQGFQPGPAGLKYLPYGKFADPCGGQPGSIMIRSPANLQAAGCGDLIYHTQKETCSAAPLAIEETFMVQFCCGQGDCDQLGIPVSKRSEIDLVTRGGGGLQTAYLTFANGTRIEPLAVGSPPEPRRGAKRQAPPPGCQNRGNHGYVEGSFDQARPRYLKTGETQIVTSTVGPFNNDTLLDQTFTATVEHTTTFTLSIGDPWSVAQAQFGESWSSSTSQGYTVHVPVFKGQKGRLEFTPVLQCVDGSMEKCDGDGGGRTEQNQICRPYTSSDGIVQGDTKFIQTD